MATTTLASHAFEPALSIAGLQVTVSDVHGHGLAAARSFRQGEVLLEASPAAVVLGAGTPRCHHCLCDATRRKLKRCTSCGHAMYCSAECQKAAWKAHHRHECKLLQHTKPHMPGVSMLLLARLLELAREDDEASEPPAAAAWASSIRAVRCLASNLDRVSPTRAQEFAAQAAMLGGLLSEAQPKRVAPPIELVTTLLATIACNGHTLSDDELQPLGLGLYPLGALANHDCNPSAAQSFRGPTLVMRALRPLAPGEAVTIGYVDLAMPGAARRRELLGGYAFNCACVRCADERADAAREAALARTAQALGAARAETLGAIDTGQWAHALHAARRAVALAESSLPPCTPSLGIEWLRLAKLLAHDGALDEACAAWRRARGVLAVTHGGDSALVGHLDVDLGACEGERRAAQAAAAAADCEES